ncbi:MAG: hypothetical protein K6B75_00265, partial [Lachnospiraceae bacterium]|nr:hypothetical protein [Lachnospiraceae bacterium]
MKKKQLGIIAGVTSLLVVIAVVTVLLVNRTTGYRTVVVAEAEGTSNVTREGDVIVAYEGMHLKSSDNVTVLAESDMLIRLDSDKYVYAEAGTRFSL